MKPPTLSIDPNVLHKFPAMTVAAVTATIDDPACLKKLNDKLVSQLTPVVERLNTVEPITQLEEIAQWRQAYGSMSIKPSKFHSSIEALLRRVKKGDDISTGLPIVDLYNLISVIHGTPMGAYDLDKLPDAEIVLRLANPASDNFDPLGGKADSYPLNEDLVIYAAGSDVLCWGINTRDSVRSCVDDTSRTIVFMSEASSENTSLRPVAALDMLATELADLGIATSDVMTASQSVPKIAL